MLTSVTNPLGSGLAIEKKIKSCAVIMLTEVGVE